MKFTWPFLMNIRKVVIGGTVKKDQKEKKWDDLLALSSGKKVKVFDYLAEEAAILNTNAALL
jgi:hypothetical protein